MSDRTSRLKKRLAQERPKARQLVRTLGQAPAEQVFDIVLRGGLVRPQIEDTRKSDEEVLGIVDLFLDVELDNVARTGRVLGDLATKLSAGQLAAVANGNVMAPAAYGAAPGESQTRRAARWINNASTTTRNDQDHLVDTNNVIAMAVAAQTPMNSLQGIDYINSLLLEQGGRTEPRGPVILPRSALPSSPGGRRMLEIAVQFLSTRTPGNPDCRWQDLACYLLGATIACHGFSDANGRTGRVLFAIYWLRGGGEFQGITMHGEQRLTQLP